MHFVVNATKQPDTAINFDLAKIQLNLNIYFYHQLNFFL